MNEIENSKMTDSQKILEMLNIFEKSLVEENDRLKRLKEKIFGASPAALNKGEESRDPSCFIDKVKSTGEDIQSLIYRNSEILSELEVFI